MTVQKPRSFLLLQGAVILCIGLIFTFNWEFAAYNLARYLGIILIVGAALSLYNTYRLRDVSPSGGLFILIPAVAIVSGLILLFFPEYTLMLFALSIGLWVMFDGINQIKAGSELKKMDRNLGRGLVFMGILSLFICALVFINPEGLIKLMTIFFGLLMSAAGLFLLFLGLSSR